MKKIQSIWLLLLILFLNCTEFGDEDDSINYTQEPIPWPSLADSPWPMYKGNPQGNGINHTANNLEGELTQIIQTENYSKSFSNILIDETENLYVTVFQNNIVHKYSSDYDLLWSTNISGKHSTVATSTPLLSSNNTIYVATDSLWAIDIQDGKKLWGIELENLVIGNLNIDLDGNILLIDEIGLLYSINSDGEFNWIVDSPFSINPNIGIVISPNGTQLYTVGERLSAYNVISGVIMWTFDPMSSTNFNTFPAVSMDGSIHFVSFSDTTSILWSINDSGQVNWQQNISLGDPNKSTSPIITIDGRIVITIENNIYSYNLLGESEWSSSIESSAWSSMASDNQGNVYIGTTQIYNPFITAFSIAGQQLWQTPIDRPMDSGLSISYDKLIFAAEMESGLYSVFKIE